jgi:hypothetical protein
LLIRRKFVGSDTTAALANSSQKRTAACSKCSKEASSYSRCRAQQEEIGGINTAWCTLHKSITAYLHTKAPL